MAKARKYFTCRHCHKGFMAVVPEEETRQSCGHSPCWEKEFWTQEQWAGRKRMVRAYLASEFEFVVKMVGDEITVQRRSVELNALDREALARG